MVSGIFLGEPLVSVPEFVPSVNQAALSLAFHEIDRE
jgi:hypothetical protein